MKTQDEDEMHLKEKKRNEYKAIELCNYTEVTSEQFHPQNRQLFLWQPQAQTEHHWSVTGATHLKKIKEEKKTSHRGGQEEEADGGVTESVGTSLPTSLSASLQSSEAGTRCWSRCWSLGKTWWSLLQGAERRRSGLQHCRSNCTGKFYYNDDISNYKRIFKLHKW